MKVIFLDFDGVLNSKASFIVEERIRRSLGNISKEKKKEMGISKVGETLCHVCCSNFQLILEHFPEVKIVISSTWRGGYTLDWLKEKLTSYGIDSSRVIDKTPIIHGADRGHEIRTWLSEHPDVKKFVIIDDDVIGDGFNEEIVVTTWNVGLTLDHANAVLKVLGSKSSLNLQQWE
jgi:hypothetical protein